MPFLALPACTGLCRPRFYGDPVGDRRHHLDWDSPMTRSIPLKEGRERDTEPVIPRGGPGEPLGHPSAAGIGVWPLWAPPPPSSGSYSWSPRDPFCFSPRLPPSPLCQRGLLPYWICPSSPVLTHPSRGLAGQNCRLAPAPALGLAVRVQAGPRSIGLLRRCD